MLGPMPIGDVEHCGVVNAHEMVITRGCGSLRNISDLKGNWLADLNNEVFSVRFYSEIVVICLIY